MNMRREQILKGQKVLGKTVTKNPKQEKQHKYAQLIKLKSIPKILTIRSLRQI